MTLRGPDIYDSADFHEPMEESEDQDPSRHSPPPESVVLGPLHGEQKPNKPARRVREAICQDTQDWHVFEDNTDNGIPLVVLRLTPFRPCQSRYWSKTEATGYPIKHGSYT